MAMEQADRMIHAWYCDGRDCQHPDLTRLVAAAYAAGLERAAVIAETPDANSHPGEPVESLYHETRRLRGRQIAAAIRQAAWEGTR